jgi:hypothetical protein
MRILPIQSAEHNPIFMAIRDTAAHLIHTATHGAQALAPAAHAVLDGLQRANLPFCTYGAVACVLGLA